MTKNPYRVDGTFLMGNKWTKFGIETVAESEDEAKERVLSLIGSKHRTPRRRINVDTVQALSLDDVENPVVEAIAAEE